MWSLDGAVVVLLLPALVFSSLNLFLQLSEKEYKIDFIDPWL